MFEIVALELKITHKTTVVPSVPSWFYRDLERNSVLFTLRQDGPLLLASDCRKLAREVLGVGTR